MKERKNQLKRVVKQEAGVTIATMIIAVILVIILAAISITSVLDEERNIFDTAYEAKTGIEVATYEEELEVIKVNCTTSQLNNGLTSDEYIDLFKESVEKDTTFDGSTVEKKSSTILRIETKEGYVFIITADGVEYAGISGEFDEVYELSDEDVTFTYTPSDWTNENVTVEISLNFDIGENSFQYSFDKETWYDYEGSFEVETNTKIYVMYSPYGDNYVIGEVENIDKTAPEVELEVTDTTTNSITIEVTAEDLGDDGTSESASGIAKYEFQISTDGETWETVETVETSDETYEYTYKGLTDDTTYYVRVIVTDVADNGTTSNEKEISLFGANYVDYSATYEVIEDGDSTNDWRLFFVTEEEYTSVYGDETISAADCKYNDDETLVQFTTTADDQVYLIAADYILADNMPTSTSGTSVKYSDDYPYSLYFYNIWSEYTGTTNWDSQVDIWNSLFLNSDTVTYQDSFPEKAVEYLLDTSAWNTFYLDTGYTDTSYGKYVIGSPTIEMWCAAWNQKYGEELTLYCDKVTSYGYRISSDGTLYSNFVYAGPIEETSGYDDTIFYPHHSAFSGAEGIWLSSPGSRHVHSILNVFYHGRYRYTNRIIRRLLFLYDCLSIFLPPCSFSKSWGSRDI